MESLQVTESMHATDAIIRDSSFDSSFLDRRQLSKFPSVVRSLCGGHEKDGIKRGFSVKITPFHHQFLLKRALRSWMDLDRDLYDVFASFDVICFE